MKRATSSTLAGVALSALVALSCSGQQDLAAVLVSELDEAEGASPGLEGEPPDSFELLGVPSPSGRPPFEIAEWPLETSLRAFFGDSRVAVRGDDRAPLWRLRQAVAAGEYGPSRDTVLVQDRSGDRYFVVFTDD